MLSSYPKIYNLGHPQVAEIFNGPVVIEEKVDGSQFSFGVVYVDGGTELQCRSKGANIDIDNPPALFAPAVQTARTLDEAHRLRPGWVYRGEAFQKPKHNILAYDRAPKGGIILFDVEVAPHEFLAPQAKAWEASLLGLECVPEFAITAPESAADFLAIMDTTSCLGGQKIEGVVIKAHGRYGADGKTLMAKHVSEAFKEIKGPEWRAMNPTRGDLVQRLIDRYGTAARWQKALIHLREHGIIEGSPRDIGPLIRAAQADLLQECAEDIKASLFAHFRDQVVRGATRGLPEWYKQQLVAKQFEEVVT